MAAVVMVVTLKSVVRVGIVAIVTVYSDGNDDDTVVDIDGSSKNSGGGDGGAGY